LNLVDCDRDGGGGLPEAVGGVEGVAGVGRGSDGDGSTTDGTDTGRNDDVGGAGNLPGECDGRTGRHRGGAADELSDRRCAANGDVGAGVERGHLDDFEIGGENVSEIVEVGIVPTIIGGAAEVHGRAVVGKDQAVFFQGNEDDLIGGRKTGNVERGF